MVPENVLFQVSISESEYYRIYMNEEYNNVDLQREFLSHTLPPMPETPLFLRYKTLYVIGSEVDQSQQSRPANQSEQTGLWFQTEGERRCCSTGGRRKIKSFLNIKAWRHVPEAQHR